MFGYAFLAWILVAGALTVDMLRFDEEAFYLRFGQPRRAKIAAVWVWLFPLFMIFGFFWVMWWLASGRPTMVAAWREKQSGDSGLLNRAAQVSEVSRWSVEMDTVARAWFPARMAPQPELLERDLTRMIAAGLDKSEQFVWWHDGSWLTNVSIYSFVPDRFVKLPGPLVERPEVASSPLKNTIPSRCEWVDATSVSNVGTDLRVVFNGPRTATLSFQLPDVTVEGSIPGTVIPRTELVKGGLDVHARDDARRRIDQLILAASERKAAAVPDGWYADPSSRSRDDLTDLRRRQEAEATQSQATIDEVAETDRERRARQSARRGEEIARARSARKSGNVAHAQPSPTVEPGVPPGWYADPSVRFELRYWDGAAWTEHVSSGGQQHKDPPVA